MSLIRDSDFSLIDMEVKAESSVNHMHLYSFIDERVQLRFTDENYIQWKMSRAIRQKIQSHPNSDHRTRTFCDAALGHRFVSHSVGELIIIVGVTRLP